MAEPRYHRLTRARARTGAVISISRCSLWLGEDHLLSVDSTGYAETYRRFYFRDIQAITLTQTPWWLYWALALGVFAALFGAIAVFSGEAVLAYVFGPVALLFLLGLVYDLLAGPSCACELRTAVQTVRLPPLNRVRRAREVLARLHPLFSAAQGELEPGEVRTRLEQASTPKAPSPATDAGPAGGAPPVLGADSWNPPSPPTG